LVYGCPLPNVDIIWTNHSSPDSQLWLFHYISRMQLFVSMLQSSISYVNLGDD